MAGPLKPPPPRRAAPGARLGALAWATLLVLVLHLLALTWLRWQLQPASVLRKIPPTFYTRTLAPQARRNRPLRQPNRRLPFHHQNAV